jgi:hypothetical protein
MNGAQIVTSVDDVPAGYIRLADAVPGTHPKRMTLLQYLSTAQRKGKLPAYKLIRRASEKGIGAVFIHEASAKEIISTWESRAHIEAAEEVTTALTEVVNTLSVINPQAPADNNQLSLQDVAQLLFAIQQNISELRREVADVRAAAELQVEAVYMRVSKNQPALEVVDG